MILAAMPLKRRMKSRGLPRLTVKSFTMGTHCIETVLFFILAYVIIVDNVSKS